MLDGSTSRVGVTESKEAVDKGKLMDVSEQSGTSGHLELKDQHRTEGLDGSSDKRTFEGDSGTTAESHSSDQGTKRAVDQVDVQVLGDMDTPADNIDCSSPSKRLKESIEPSISSPGKLLTSGDKEQVEKSSVADSGDGVEIVSAEGNNMSPPKGRKRKMLEIPSGELQV